MEGHLDESRAGVWGCIFPGPRTTNITALGDVPAGSVLTFPGHVPNRTVAWSRVVSREP